MQVCFDVLPSQLDECQWTQCIDPPIPEGRRVKPTWDGVTPYEFYSNATYVCDSDEVFFEHDRDQLYKDRSSRKTDSQ